MLVSKIYREIKTRIFLILKRKATGKMNKIQVKTFKNKMTITCIDGSVPTTSKFTTDHFHFSFYLSGF